MILDTIFTHLDFIALAMWVAFFVVVTLRVIRPSWVKRISFLSLIIIAIALHLLYASFVTWGQYYVWATGDVVSRSLLAAPLPAEAPLPALFEWLRPYLSQSFGYFAYYAFGRFFLSSLFLFFVSGIFYAVFKVWNNYRGSLGQYGPELILILLLISGWPGVFLLIPLGLIFSVLSFIVSYGTAGQRVHIEPSFLIATPIALIFARALFDYFHILNFFVT